MKDEKLVVKGNKNGINIIANMENFFGFDNFTEYTINFLNTKKAFFKNSIVIITSNFENIPDEKISKFKDEIIEKVGLKDCILKEITKNINDNKIFNGINEGRTKFIKNTVRGGQKIEYDGNVVIIGNVNNGAEISATGNIIVLGSIKGRVRAGITGNTEAIIACYRLQPQLLQISDVITLAPDDVSPSYPEIAKLKNNTIVVEPYLINKSIY